MRRERRAPGLGRPSFKPVLGSWLECSCPGAWERAWRRDAATIRRRGRLRYRESAARYSGREAGDVRNVHVLAEWIGFIILKGQHTRFRAAGANQEHAARRFSLALGRKTSNDRAKQTGNTEGDQ